VHIGDNNYDFIAGPQIGDTTKDISICTDKWRDYSAFFHFPWEIFNGFHSLNDNVLAILSNIYLQSLLLPSTSHLPKHLFLFQNLHKSGNKRPTTMYQLISRLFTSTNVDQVHAARELLTNGPHCIRHMTYGTSFKVFYKDSLQILRLKLFQFFKLSISNALDPKIFPFEFFSELHSIKSKARSSNRKPKIVIITRKDGQSGPQRKLSFETEKRLVSFYEKSGQVAEVVICCDFKVVNSIEKVLEIFWNADICIGIHGAGLANCLFGNIGMVMVEFQTHHMYGFDSFMKIAHMTLGHYLFYDIRNAEKYSGSEGPGAILKDNVLNDIVGLSLRLFYYSRDYSSPLLEGKLRNYGVNGNHSLPYKEFNQKHVFSTQSTSSSGSSRKLPSAYNENPDLIHSSFYSGETIINMHKKEFFIDFKHENVHRHFYENYFLRNATTIENVAPSIFKSQNEHVLYQNIDKQRDAVKKDPSLTNFFVQRKRPKNEFMFVKDIKIHSLPPSHREYVLFLNPYLFAEMNVSNSFLVVSSNYKVWVF
jgi:hypothetical protein